MKKSKKGYITCANCNGTGKVSSGMWIDEMEDNVMHRYETCPICKGKGIVKLGVTI